MKKVRQILVVILSFVMAVCVFAACGEDNKPGPNADTSVISVDSSSTTPAQSVAPSDSSEPDSSVAPIDSSGSGSSEENDYYTTYEVADVAAAHDANTFAVKKLENVDFHTTLQKAYLNDTLESITKYANGTSELSYPDAVKLEWSFTPSKRGLNLVNYEIKLSENDDLTDAKTYTTTAASLSIYNLKIGTDYYYNVTANYGTESFESEIVSFDTSDKGPRNLYIDGISNSRDIGGIKTEDGGMVKQGLLYRTARLNESNASSVKVEITQKGMEQMRELGMKTELDLRGYDATEPGGVTSSLLGNDVAYYFLPMQWSGVANLLLGNNESIVRTFEILADKNNYPIFYHCNIGTDRTGIITMLVGGLLGVPEEELYRDYLFSNFGNIGSARSLGDQSSVNSVYGYMNQLRAFKGNRFAEKVYNYLLTIGVPARNLNATISNLKEGGRRISGSSTFIKTSEIENNNNLVATKPTYKYAPSEYYVLNDSKSSLFAGINASEATSASVYMYVSDSNTNATVRSTVKMMVDGTEQTITANTYNTEGCRSDAQRYWVAIKLADVNLSAGDHTISLTSIASGGPNVAGIAVIPANGTVTSKKSAIVKFDPAGSGSGSGVTLVNGRTTRFEAENAEFEGTASGSSGQFVGNSDQASGGKRVGGLARSGNAVIFKFKAPADGTVDIVLAASSTQRGSGDTYMANMTVSNATLGISINSEDITYSGTANGWADSSYAYNGPFTKIPVATVDVNAGDNVIRVYYVSGSVPNIDYIELTFHAESSSTDPDAHEHEFGVVDVGLAEDETPLTWYVCEDDNVSYYEIDHTDITDKQEGTRDGGVYLSKAGDYLKVYVWVNKATAADVTIEFLVSDSSKNGVLSQNLQFAANDGALTAVSATGTYSGYGATTSAYGSASIGTVNLNEGLNMIEVYRNGTYGCTVGKVIITPEELISRYPLWVDDV